MKKLLVKKMALVFALAGATFASSAAMASAPFVKTSAPGFHRILLGAYEVTAISDGTVDLPVEKLLAEPAPITEKALTNAYLKTPVETSVNTYCLLYTSPSPRDRQKSRMPSSA